MNANELIYKLKNKLMFCEHGSTFQHIKVTPEERDEIIRELSRTRIRETETEPPTREDEDKWGHVIAYDNLVCFGIKSAKTVSENPDAYPFWSQAQQLPEVTP